MSNTAPRSKAAPWTPETVKTKAAIQRELAAAAEAEAQLPQLQAKIAGKDKAAADLKAWESQHDWPGRQEAAMSEAKSHIAKAREAEEEMKRFVGQFCESPLWRACQALQTVNTERLSAIDCLHRFVRVDFERAALSAEEGGQVPSMNAARQHKAEVASQGRVMDMLHGLDEGFEITRLLPSEQKPIMTLIRTIAFPSAMVDRPKPDSTAK
jgi:hypothetical protein